MLSKLYFIWINKRKLEHIIYIYILGKGFPIPDNVTIHFPAFFIVARLGYRKVQCHFPAPNPVVLKGIWLNKSWENLDNYSIFNCCILILS